MKSHAGNKNQCQNFVPYNFTKNTCRNCSMQKETHLPPDNDLNKIESQSHKKGWLIKLGNTEGTWTRHWFVLTPNVLKYYRYPSAEKFSQPDGEITLADISKVDKVETEKGHGFSIRTKDEDETVLAAATMDDRENWIRALPIENSSETAETPDNAGKDQEPVIAVRKARMKESRKTGRSRTCDSAELSVPPHTESELFSRPRETITDAKKRILAVVSKSQRRDLRIGKSSETAHTSQNLDQDQAQPVVFDESTDEANKSKRGRIKKTTRSQTYDFSQLSSVLATIGATPSLETDDGPTELEPFRSIEKSDMTLPIRNSSSDHKDSPDQTEMSPIDKPLQKPMPESPDKLEDVFEDLAHKIRNKDLQKFARVSEGLGLDGEIVDDIIDDYWGRAHSNKIKLFKKWMKLNPEATADTLRSIVENFGICTEEDCDENITSREDGERAIATEGHEEEVGEIENKSPQTSPKKPKGAGRKEKKVPKDLDDGYVRLCDGFFMYTKEALRKGKIYEGYQEHANKKKIPIAIKRIHDFNSKNLREVDCLIKLASHKNVVRIIHSTRCLRTTRELYIVMELCSSQNLQDYVNKNGKEHILLDFQLTMSYTKQLFAGVEFMHKNRIIHRDLKPENVLLSIDGKLIKLADFGISKELREGRSVTQQTHLRAGTDGFRAPETYLCDVITLKSDIYSLGLTIHILWTNGKHPFGHDLDKWNLNIKTNKDRDLSGTLFPAEMTTKVGEYLDLVEKLLQFEPDRRPTAEEISQHRFANE